MNTRHLSLVTFAALAVFAGAAQASVTVVLRNVHMCCGTCVKDSDEAVATVPGAEAMSDMNSKSIAITAPDHATAQKAIDALGNAGYFGTPTDASYAFKSAAPLKETNVTSAKLTGVHLCCKKCVTAANKALATVKGVTGNTAKEDEASFEVTGNFDPNEVIAALNKAGMTGTIEAKP